MKDEKSKKLRYKHYFMGAVEELKKMGYSEEEAEMIFNRYFNDIIEIWGFYLNPYDFAKEIDELHRAVQLKFDPNNPNYIYIGHLKERFQKTEIKEDSLTFTISEEMMKRINQWDQCKAVDVSGAKFAFTFIPSSLGTYIIVKCDVCERELHITDDFD